MTLLEMFTYNPRLTGCTFFHNKSHSSAILARVIFFLTVTSTAAFGRLGETREQCDARYGKPRATKADCRQYLYNGITIKVSWVRDDGADAISYRGNVLTNEYFVDGLLLSNSQEFHWASDHQQESEWNRLHQADAFVVSPVGSKCTTYGRFKVYHPAGLVFG